MLKRIISTALLITPIISTASDTFDLNANELDIPSVLVGSTYYQATLKHQGKFVFNVSSSKPIETPDSNIISDTFDLETNELSIRSVIVGNECFQAILKHQGDLVFNLQSATPIAVNLNTKTITIEPDNFSSNVDISKISSTATLSATGTDNLASNIYAFESLGQSTTESKVFGYNNIDGQNSGQWYFPERVLRIDFTSPTNFVSIGLKGFDSFDSGKMEIYNLSGTLLNTLSVDLPENTVGILSSNRNTPDISYALIYGSSKQDSAAIDNLQYNEIVSVTCNVN